MAGATDKAAWVGWRELPRLPFVKDPQNPCLESVADKLRGSKIFSTVKSPFLADAARTTGMSSSLSLFTREC